MILILLFFFFRQIPEDIKDTDTNHYQFDLDGWSRWDMPSEDYYSITQFPEEFTGYDGAEVWRFIHVRICFHSPTNSPDDVVVDEKHPNGSSPIFDFFFETHIPNFITLNV